ncbi:uncharacterized protein LOC125579964 [Brassica napus]|uniref:uncharacterized protein LOC125579964 n=1 Tax=Brassica napus TaxID=3708 RepID=UPI0006AA857D|nr:uncharacterized protein LOC125579964 [Brassica napus]
MAMSFSSLTNLVLFCAATLLLVHAGARNLQQTQTLPVHGAASPTKAESPTFNAPLDDRKNFIVGGAAGVGGFMGMPGGTGMTLPLPSGTPLLFLVAPVRLVVWAVQWVFLVLELMVEVQFQEVV